MDAGVVALTLLLAAAVRADWRHRMLPNRLVACGAVLGLSFAAVQGPLAIWLALCGGLTGALLLLPLYATHGMAAGDVKLMGMAGVFLGVPGAWYGVMGTVLAGGLMAVLWHHVMVGKQQKRAGELERMPYAPAIAAGCVGALCAQAGGMV